MTHPDNNKALPGNSPDCIIYTVGITGT